MMSDKIIQRMFVKLNPDTSRIMTSCIMMDGAVAMYVSNYPGTQAELERDFNEKKK